MIKRKNAFINLNIEGKKTQKSKRCVLEHWVENGVYVNDPDSRVIKESKNNHMAMHENNLM